MKQRVLVTTDVVGGVWDFCMTLADGLRCAGDEVVLLALGTPSLAQRRAVDQTGAQLISVPLKLEWMAGAFDNGDVALTRDLVAQVARQVGADTVHANQFAAVCANVSVPVILTVHSDVLSWRRWTLGANEVPTEWASYAELVREACARADSVVAVSRFLADEVTELYSVRRPIDVIHNGWPASAIDPDPARTGTVVAGRIWDGAKNIRLVAEAAAQGGVGDVVLAGDVGHPDGGTAEVPPPLQPVGFLTRAELDHVLQHARIYVSAAKYDPFGLLPLQAALQGCILLLSDIPSYREVWGDAAHYFRSGEAADLHATWAALQAAPPDMRAYEHATALLTSSHMVEAYRRQYAAMRHAVAA